LYNKKSAGTPAENAWWRKKFVAGIWPVKGCRMLWVEIKNRGLKMALFSGRWTY
jgi:hypothetical protein